MNQRSSAAAGAKRQASELVVRQAADQWAAGVRDLEPSTVLAVFVHALSASVDFDSLRFNQGSTTPWMSNPFGGLPLRPLEAWREGVGTLENELLKLAPYVPAERRADCSARLLHSLTVAADEWSLGDPEKPSTNTVVVTLARQLFDDGLYTWWDLRGVRP